MKNKIYLNECYEIKGLFNLPCGECYGTLYLNPHNSYLELVVKMGLEQTSFKLSSSLPIKGLSVDYGNIIIVNHLLHRTIHTTNKDGNEICQITISVHSVLFCEQDYDSIPLFKEAKISIEGTKEWLGVFDKDLIDKKTTKALDVRVNEKGFKVNDDYSIITNSGKTRYDSFSTKIESFIRYEFDERISIFEAQEIFYQWLILQTILSGLATPINRIIFCDGHFISQLYHQQRNDRVFDDVSNISTFHQEELGGVDFNKICDIWFSRDDKRVSVGNLFYTSLTQLIFSPERYLNMVRAIEGWVEDKATDYIAEEDKDNFKNDKELKKILKKYLKNPSNLIKRITNKEKNSFEERIKLTLNEIPKSFLNIINWKNDDPKKIVKIRNNYSHWQAGVLGDEILRESVNYYYKIQFLLIYLHLHFLEIPDEKIINFIAKNQKFSSIILDRLKTNSL